MKLECIVLVKSREEAKWLQNFLEDISYWPKPMLSICFNCNSQSAIRKTQSCVYNTHTHTHIVKHLLSNWIIFINYVNSKKRYIRSANQMFIERTFI